MPPPVLPVEGACRCGETRLRISAQPFMTSACHCRGCQRMASSAYSLTAMIPSQGFEVTHGTPVIGGLRDPAQAHHFCPRCMTWMFTRIGGYDEFVNLRPTLMDDPAWCEPFIETCTAERLPWVTTPARHSFEGFPPMDRFEDLMRAFAEHLGP